MSEKILFLESKDKGPVEVPVEKPVEPPLIDSPWRDIPPKGPEVPKLGDHDDGEELGDYPRYIKRDPSSKKPFIN